MELETKKKLLESVTFIENTAQNQQINDTVPSNEWDTIEAQARDLRELIEELETKNEYQRRQQENV